MTNRRLGIIFIVMLFGALLPAYFFTQQPAAILGPAIQKLNGDTAFTAAATIAMLAPETVVQAAGGDAETLLPIVFVGEGGMNFPKDKPPSGRGTFVMTGEEDDAKALTLDVVAAQDGTSYAKLMNLPSGEGASPLLKAIDGSWFSMPSRTLAAIISRDPINAQAPNTGTRPVGTWQGIRDQLANPDLYGYPTQIGSISLRTPFIRHYRLPLVQDPVIALAQDLRSLRRGRSLSSEELAQVAAEVRASVISLEVWVDSRSHDIMQLQVNVRSADAAEQAKDIRQFNAVIKFSNWGEAVDVATPAESRPYSDIVMPAPQP